MHRAILLLTVVLLGCAEPMESVSLDFRAEPLEADERREWSVARLEPGRHRVTVRRTAAAVRDCGDLQAELLRTGRDLTLRVRDSTRPGGGNGKRECGYTAVLDGIPPGQYTLRIVHSGGASRSSARVVMNQPLHIR